MTTEQIAQQLIALCENLQYNEADEQLYHESIESNEPNPERSTKGIEAKKAKTTMHQEMVTYKSVSLSQPLISGSFFSVVIDATWINHKANDQEETVSELCVYQVKDGKIRKERFYMDIPES